MRLLAESEIVIIGGGAIGCGVAHSLARAGKTDVVLGAHWVKRPSASLKNAVGCLRAGSWG